MKMKMKLRRLGAEKEASGPLDGGRTIRTVVVGVNLAPPSRELLTWALVKVAQPGETVVALHVLNSTEVVDQNGQSSLLSLFKAFESVLSVYEGFCNLKQVDLKLKICRGTSVRKVLVQEAKSFAASTLIVGTARNNRALGPSASIAKYCAKKLPLDCSVLAVNNGKVLFRRRSSTVSAASTDLGNVKENRLRSARLLDSLHRSLSKNSKAFNARPLALPSTTENRDLEKRDGEDLYDSGLKLNCLGIPLNKNSSHNLKSRSRKCSICESDSTRQPEERSNDSLALVPVKTSAAGSPHSFSVCLKELPELRPGWPLLRQAILPDRRPSDRCKVGQVSVVQWALRLPSRRSVVAVHPDQRPMKADGESTIQCGARLDGESGAIVPLGDCTSPPADDGGSKTLPKELESLHAKYSSTCRLFSYQELQSATSDFSSDMLIGKGGSSKVYKGRLPDGKELAVKILKSSGDALKEFTLEIEIITSLHHKNIISLFGFCFENGKLILVYDFLSKGSLEENLHGAKNQIALSWVERYKVAVGVAEALEYVHSSSSQSVIHRDVKSSNILITDDFEPKLSDFGLATWASMSSVHITCGDVAGTFGYLAPEYFMYGKVNDKIDVYSFGVVLLELLSGRKPINNEYPKGQQSLVMWAKPILQNGKVMQLLDPSLGDEYDNDQAEKMVLAASLCIRRAPRLRPRMGLILKLLQGDAEVTKWARSQVNTSEDFDGLDDEAYSVPNIQSHLNLALLDVEDDSLSISSIEQGINYITANRSLEDYLRGRWSRSSSFD